MCTRGAGSTGRAGLGRGQVVQVQRCQCSPQGFCTLAAPPTFHQAAWPSTLMFSATEELTICGSPLLPAPLQMEQLSSLLIERVQELEKEEGALRWVRSRGHMLKWRRRPASADQAHCHS